MHPSFGSRPWLFALVAPCLVAPCLIARPARSEASGSGRQETGSSCAPNEDVQQRVVDLVGPDARGLGHANVRAQKTTGGRYLVVVSVDTPKGNAVRQFEAASCGLGIDIAALIVAISLYPERAAELEDRAHAKAPPSVESMDRRAGPGLAAPHVDAPDRDQEGARARSHSLWLAAEVLADLTSMPSAALGGNCTPSARSMVEKSAR